MKSKIMYKKYLFVFLSWSLLTVFLTSVYCAYCYKKAVYNMITVPGDMYIDSLENAVVYRSDNAFHFAQGIVESFLSDGKDSLNRNLDFYVNSYSYTGLESAEIYTGSSTYQSANARHADTSAFVHQASNNDSSNIIPTVRIINNENVLSYVFNSGELGVSGTNFHVILNFDRNYLNEISKNQNSNANYTSIIYNQNNEVLSVSDNIENPDEFISSFKSGKQKFRILNIGSEKYCIFSKLNTKTGVSFIAGIPVKNINLALAKNQIFYILAGLLLLTLWAAVSFFVAKKLYLPVEELAVSFKNINRVTKNLAESKRSKEIGDFILKKGGLNGNSLFNNVPCNSYGAVVIKIKGASAFLNDYTSSDRNLIRYGILNICNELICENCEFENVTVSETEILILLGFPGEADLLKVKKNCQMSVENIEKVFSLNIVIGISNIGCSMDMLPELYQTAQISSKETILKNQSVCKYEDSDPIEFHFSEDKNSKFKNAVLSCRSAEAFAIANEIISEAKTYPDFELTILNIGISLSNCVNMVKNTNSGISFSFNTFIADIGEIETKELILEYIEKAIKTLCTMIEGNKMNKHEILVKNVISYIEEHFSDTNLSINVLAEKMEMSPIYFGKLFRKSASKSVADFINEVRLKKAKEELVNTNKSLNEIVKDIGYTNTSYFCTLFKKRNGVTPNEYRKIQRSDEAKKEQEEHVEQEE